MITRITIIGNKLVHGRPVQMGQSTWSFGQCTCICAFLLPEAGRLVPSDCNLQLYTVIVIDCSLCETGPRHLRFSLGLVPSKRTSRVAVPAQILQQVVQFLFIRAEKFKTQTVLLISITAK